MINLIIPEISPTAGVNSDGVVLGSVSESDFIAALTDVPISDVVYALRKDVTGTTFTFTNISTPAGDDTTSDFLPWGTTAQMTAGDELFIACDHAKAELFFKIDTPGVWDGSIQIRYSSNGQTANTILQNVVDGTNGFRASAGIYSVTFTIPTDIVAFSPVPGDIASRQWFVIKPTITGVTTAPILSRVWVRHSDTTVVDLSSLINEDIITQGQGHGHPPDIFPTIDSSVYYAFPNPAYGMERDIYLKAGNTRTRVVEYLATDNTWKTLPGWTDPSNDYTNGPSPQAVNPTRYSVRWTMPSDWLAKAKSFTTNSGTVSYTGYWIRERTTAVSQFGPMIVTVANISARQFGNMNTTGVELRQSMSVLGITVLNATTPNTTDSVCQIANMTTGQASSFTIPANPVFPVNVDTVDIAFTAGQRLGVICNSGGTLQNAQITLIG